MDHLVQLCLLLSRDRIPARDIQNISLAHLTVGKKSPQYAAGLELFFLMAAQANFALV